MEMISTLGAAGGASRLLSVTGASVSIWVPARRLLRGLPRTPSQVGVDERTATGDGGLAMLQFTSCPRKDLSNLHPWNTAYGADRERTEFEPLYSRRPRSSPLKRN